MEFVNDITKENENKVLQVFIKRQVNQSMSVGRAVGSITSNYPDEHTSRRWRRRVLPDGWPVWSAC